MVRASLVPVLFRPRAFVPLTFSGDLITDAVRAAGVSGDGLMNDSSTGIWPAATNLLTAPTDFSNAAWQAITGGKTSTTEPDPGGGTTGIKFTNAAGYNTLRQTKTVLAATEYTFHFWAKRGTAAKMQYSVFDNTHAAEITGTVDYYAQTNASTYSHIAVTFTTPAACTSILCDLNRDNDAVGTWWGAWPQLETGAVATPFTPTSRAAGRVQVPNVAPYQLITAAQGAVAMRVQMSYAHTVLPNTAPVLANWSNVVQGQDEIRLALYNGNFYAIRNAGGVAADKATALSAWSAGDKVNFGLLLTPTQIGTMQGGAAFSMGANTKAPVITSSLMVLGSFGTFEPAQNYRVIDANIHLTVFWNDKSDLTAVQANPALINSLLTAGVTDLNAYPGNASGLWDGNSQFMEVRA